MTGGLAFAVQVRIIDEFITPMLSGIDASSLVSYGLSAEEILCNEINRGK